MRRRLLVSTALIALATVLVLGIPLAFVEANRERTDAAFRLEREADVVAAAIDDRVEAGQPVDPATVAPLVRTGHQVTIREPGGSAIRVGSPIQGERISARSGARGATRVTVSESASEVDRQVHRRWLVIALLALAAVAAAVLLALLQGRRLSRPLEQLARTSTLLGEGDFSARAGRSAIAEIDAVAVALDATAVRIATLIAREREFASNAAHQLRTPLTALRLRLDELEAVHGAELGHALHEVDRLQATIDDLLAMARDGRAGEAQPLDLHALARAHATRWRPLVTRAGRRLSITGDGTVTPHVSTGALGQALDVLIDNALHHGAGTITVSIGERDGRALLAVSDEGGGIAAGEERHIFDRGDSSAGGTGVGLHLARTLVEAEGGRLRLAAARPPRFEIALPS